MKLWHFHNYANSIIIIFILRTDSKRQKYYNNYLFIFIHEIMSVFVTIKCKLLLKYK
jgi:hypothetical protein